MLLRQFAASNSQRSYYSYANRYSEICGAPLSSSARGATRSGIRFWNDSCATTPSATAAAIRTFSKEPFVLVTGGSEKNADYEELGKTIAEIDGKALITMGITGPKIADLAQKQDTIRRKLFLEKILKECFRNSKKFLSRGDNVLLSPASASFDQFQNEYDRGEKWNATVNGFLRKIK